jgi:hypothetical protein
MILVEKGARAWFLTNERGIEFSVHPSDLTNDLDVIAQFQKPRSTEVPGSVAASTSLPAATSEPQSAPAQTAAPEIDSASQPTLTAEVVASAPPVAEPEPSIASGADYITQHKIRTLRAQIFYSSQELATKQAQLGEVYGARDRGGSINRVYYYAGSPYSYAHSRRITSSNGSEFVLKKEIDLLNKKLDALNMQLSALTGQ